jgi:hypothetical protein
MKKFFSSQLLILGGFFAIIIFLKQWFTLAVWPFLVGGIIGIFLPEVDYLIYIYFLRPTDPISLQAKALIKARKFQEAFSLLHQIDNGEHKLTFHSALFYGCFVLFSFLVISSSGSFLGRGLVLGFLVNLDIAQWKAYKNEELNQWFATLNMNLNHKHQALYMSLIIFVTVILGLFF